MKLQVLCLSTLFLASVPLTAQKPSGFGVMGAMSDPASGGKISNVDSAKGNAAEPSCPISMRAQQRTSATGLMRAGDWKAAVPGQRIHLDVDRGPNAVTAIQITVRGTTARPRVYTAQSQQVRSDAVKSFTLTADGASADGAAISSDLLLRGFTSVQSVNLDSVSYDDGSIWTPAGGKGCSVAPDPLMLVSSR